MTNRILRMGEQAVIDEERRNAVLEGIVATREEVRSRLAELPAWAVAPGGPLGEDQAAFEQARAAMAAAEPTVDGIEARLLTTPGPVWAALSPEEDAALAQWTSSADVVADLLKKHFPRTVERDIVRVVLFALGAGALFAPLFWTEDLAADRRPFLPRLPWAPGEPSAMPPRPFAAAAAPAFRPVAPAAAPGMPIRVTPEIFRPGEIPRRTFTAPLGPGAPTAAGPTPFRPPATPGAGATPHTPVYPRWRPGTAS